MAALKDETGSDRHHQRRPKVVPVAPHLAEVVQRPEMVRRPEVANRLSRNPHNHNDSHDPNNNVASPSRVRVLVYQLLRHKIVIMRRIKIKKIKQVQVQMQVQVQANLVKR
jgi:hypothetical protein